MTTREPNTNRGSTFAVAMGAIAAATYGVLFLGTFGSSDDYTFFQLSFAPEGSFLPPALDNGRPLLWPSFDKVAGAADSFEVMWRFRLVFVVGMAFATAGAFWVLRHLWGSDRMAAAGAALMMLSPPWVDASSTGANSWLSFVAAATFAAYWAHIRALETLPESRARAALWWAGAVALVVVGGSMHQSPLMLWVSLATAAALWPARSTRATLRRLFADAVALGGAVAVYGATMWGALPSILGVELTERRELTDAPITKALWFVAMPLRDALNLPVIFGRDVFFDALTQTPRRVIDSTMLQDAATSPAYWLALVVGAFCAVGLVVHVRRDERPAWLLMGGVVLALPLSLSLNVVISSWWAPFRTQAGLVGVVAVVAVVAGRRLLDGVDRRGRDLAVGAAIVGASVLTAVNSYAYVVRPLSCEWRALLVAVGKAGDAERVAVRPLHAGDGATWGARYEVGRAASAAPWAPEPMVWVARRELGFKPAEKVLVLSPDASRAPEGFELVSLSSCAEGASAPVE